MFSRYQHPKACRGSCFLLQSYDLRPIICKLPQLIFSSLLGCGTCYASRDAIINSHDMTTTIIFLSYINHSKENKCANHQYTLRHFLKLSFFPRPGQLDSFVCPIWRRTYVNASPLTQDLYSSFRLLINTISSISFRFSDLSPKR